MKNEKDENTNSMTNETIMLESKEEPIAIPQKEASILKLDVKDLFIQIMKSAINNKNLDEPFFCRPDCIAQTWLLLNKNYDNVLYDPLINCLEDFLIQVLSDWRCSFEWSMIRKVKVYSVEIYPDHLKLVSELQKELKLSDEFVAQDISIKEIAQNIQCKQRPQNRRLFTANEFVIEPSREEWIRLLMYRVLAVSSEDYDTQGFLE